MYNPRHMKYLNIRFTSTLSVFIVTLMILVGLPNTSEASYKISPSSNKAIGEHVAIMTNTFSFGLSAREVYIPIKAERSLNGENVSNLSVGYKLINDNSEVTKTGQVVSLVVSDATIKNNMYYVPKGESATFTVFSIVTTPDNPVSDYSVRLTELPYFVKLGSSDEGLSRYELPILSGIKIKSINYTKLKS